MPKSQKRGFTLIELLIVIGILATLATATVLIINPTEKLKESRDAKRLNDLQNIKTAIDLAITNAALTSKVFDLDSTSNTSCAGQSNPLYYISVPSDNGENDPPIAPPWSVKRIPTASYRDISGFGWIPIDFRSSAPGQSTPFASLPADPVNTVASGFYYTYTCGSFEIGGVFESGRYQAYQANNGGDGGDDDRSFEIGSSLVIAPQHPDPSSGGGPPPPNPPPPPPSPAPTITSASPSGNQGATLTVSIIGTNLVPNPIVTFGGTGITVNSLPFIGSTQIDANITIAANALSGLRNLTVTTDNGSGTGTGAFTVNQVTLSTGYAFGSSAVASANITSPTTATGGCTNYWFCDDTNPPLGSDVVRASSLTTSPNVKFSGFSWTIDPSETVQGICMLLDDVSVANTTDPLQITKFNAALSWDGGNTFPAAQENTQMPDVAKTVIAGNFNGDEYYFTDSVSVPLNTDPGTACTTWNKTWSSTDLSSGNFFVRVTATANNATANTLRFDVLKVKILHAYP